MPAAAPLCDIHPVDTRPVKAVTVGVDGSYWGGMALDWAARHAWSRGAALRVLRARDDIPSDVPTDLGLSHTHRLYPLLPITSRAVGASPVVDLTTTSADASLIVLGCRGHRRFGLGDLVIPVLTGARCDVLVVRGTPLAVHGDHRHVTAMISGGPNDALILRHAADFAAAYHSRLRVVHAAPDTLRPDTAPEDVLSLAELQLKALDGPVRTSFTLVRALPHEVLQHADNTDLIVLAPGRSPHHPNALGPITRTALYQSPSPVLVVRG